MRHRVKKIRFKGGKDATDMLVRKLAKNFLYRGKIQTTFKKAKVLKTVVEKLMQKTKNKTEANKNYLLRYLSDNQLIDLLFENVGPSLKDKVGGYVRVIKLGVRSTDGAAIAKLEWVYPVVIKPKVDADKIGIETKK